MLFCNAYTSLAVQGACVATSFCSNLVRHDPALIPPVEDVPKSAFLTVHTITVEFAYASLGALDAAWRLGSTALGPPPRWLAALAHSGDAFVLSLGALLFGAYYGLVHGEIVATAEERGTPAYVSANHVVHFPTLFLPLLCAAAKDPALLRAHAPRTKTVLVAAAAYGVAYATHVTRCADRAKEAPYAFMKRLDTTRRRACFWGAGVACAVLPITLAAARVVGRLAARAPRRGT